MGFVIEIEDDGRMILIDSRAVFPKGDAVLVRHGMLGNVRAPLATVRPVQVEDDVAVLGGAGDDHLFDQGSVARAVVLLLRSFAKPPILRQGQTNDVGAPFLNGRVHRLQNVPLAVAGPFETGGINATQRHGFIPAIEDGRLIQMREPSESWKANVFWGLLFGLLLVLPPLFAPKDTPLPLWKKYGAMALGVAWMTFMGRSAIQNHGRTVRCDTTSIQISSPFASKRILLSDVNKLVRNG